MVVDSLALRPTLAFVGLTVCETADVANALVAKLSSEVCLHERVGNAQIFGEIGISFTDRRLDAAEGQVFHAVLIVRHLVMVVEPCIIRSSNFEDVIDNAFSWVCAALVLHLLLHNSPGILAHVFDVCEACLCEPDHTILIEVGLDAVEELRLSPSIWRLQVVGAAVNRKLFKWNGILPSPESWHDVWCADPETWHPATRRHARSEHASGPWHLKLPSEVCIHRAEGMESDRSTENLRCSRAENP
mmetsp:Transcript_40682/g.73302  ORF Transcript_40682/g.73302 Transcript_40682/m.73302 type:complete len:245 (-) Transcript_40682:3-737(-)